jgi:hypothetical protein
MASKQICEIPTINFTLRNLALPKVHEPTPTSCRLTAKKNFHGVKKIGQMFHYIDLRKTQEFVLRNLWVVGRTKVEKHWVNRIQFTQIDQASPK